MDYVSLKDSGKDGEQLMPETTVSRKSTQQRLCVAGKQNYLKAPGSLNKMAKQLLSLEKVLTPAPFLIPTIHLLAGP